MVMGKSHLKNDLFFISKEKKNFELGGKMANFIYHVEPAGPLTLMPGPLDLDDDGYLPNKTDDGGADIHFSPLPDLVFFFGRENRPRPGYYAFFSSSFPDKDLFWRPAMHVWTCLIKIHSSLLCTTDPIRMT